MHQTEFIDAVLSNPVNRMILERLSDLGAPDCWLVSGALFQTVWNNLTNRPRQFGIRDYDVFYFDPDTSWQAEDLVIERLERRLAHLGVKIEARNQARVHLWYPAKHGLPYPALTCSAHRIDRFLTRNTQVGMRRHHTGYEVYAPNGFSDIAAMIVRPNRGSNFSAANYAAKAMRWKRLWPELTIIDAEAADQNDVVD